MQSIKKLLTKQLLLVSIVSPLVLLSGCAPKHPGDNAPPINTKSIAAPEQRPKVNHVALGMTALKHHDIPTARTEFMAATQNAPNQPASWYGMGYFQESVGNLAAAEKSYKHAISIAPYAGKARNNYGSFLCRQGRYRAAIKEFVTAAKAPHYKTKGAAYENAGLCSLQEKQYFSAKKFFTQAVKANPNQANPFLQLARVYYHEGKSDPALFYLSKYAKLKHSTVAEAYALLRNQQYIKNSKQPTHHTKKHPHVIKHHALTKAGIQKEHVAIIQTATKLLQTDNKKPGDFKQLSHQVDSLLK